MTEQHKQHLLHRPTSNKNFSNIGWVLSSSHLLTSTAICLCTCANSFTIFLHLIRWLGLKNQLHVLLSVISVNVNCLSEIDRLTKHICWTSYNDNVTLTIVYTKIFELCWNGEMPFGTLSNEYSNRKKKNIQKITPSANVSAFSHKTKPESNSCL